MTRLAIVPPRLAAAVLAQFVNTDSARAAA